MISVRVRLALHLSALNEGSMLLCNVCNHAQQDTESPDSWFLPKKIVGILDTDVSAVCVW
jgi:membrane-bound lytic murein transglycosylase MltF